MPLNLRDVAEIYDFPQSIMVWWQLEVLDKFLFVFFVKHLNCSYQMESLWNEANCKQMIAKTNILFHLISVILPSICMCIGWELFGVSVLKSTTKCVQTFKL